MSASFVRQTHQLRVHCHDPRCNEEYAPRRFVLLACGYTASLLCRTTQLLSRAPQLFRRGSTPLLDLYATFYCSLLRSKDGAQHIDVTSLFPYSLASSKICRPSSSTSSHPRNAKLTTLFCRLFLVYRLLASLTEPSRIVELLLLLHPLCFAWL